MASLNFDPYIISKFYFIILDGMNIHVGVKIETRYCFRIAIDFIYYGQAAISKPQCTGMHKGLIPKICLNLSIVSLYKPDNRSPPYPKAAPDFSRILIINGNGVMRFGTALVIPPWADLIGREAHIYHELLIVKLQYKR